ncbi:hypothetical protein RND71_007043 [Anisodus tanguticus]|uniref:Uncharacterized protein n=1 Tax=Anisodus tanguticus TaxID=243964 RepID=A0AAE1SL29_9SOLA|nr:hypothetical protein RND71_007043 [Anisodus tanguticus]
MKEINAFLSFCSETIKELARRNILKFMQDLVLSSSHNIENASKKKNLFTQLQIMDLSSNRFERCIPSIVRDLIGLRTLNLSDNGLEDNLRLQLHQYHHALKSQQYQQHLPSSAPSAGPPFNSTPMISQTDSRKGNVTSKTERMSNYFKCIFRESNTGAPTFLESLSDIGQSTTITNFSSTKVELRIP